MKKTIFTFAIIAAFVASMAMGCSSTKKAGSSDSTNADSNKMKAPMDTPSNGGVDTAKSKMMDTTKKDTTRKP